MLLIAVWTLAAVGKVLVLAEEGDAVMVWDPITAFASTIELIN